MKEDKILELFKSADIEVQELKKIPNQYFPMHPHYDEFRNDSPWWLVMTPFGIIEIGKRMNKISINWEKTAFRGILTPDKTTQKENKIIVDDYKKATHYLITLNERLKSITI
jgi:hypothetical protein